LDAFDLAIEDHVCVLRSAEVEGDGDLAVFCSKGESLSDVIVAVNASDALGG
jgi:hypothetical protein